MSYGEVKKALEMLETAQQLLNESELENLKKSSGYLNQSIQRLRHYCAAESTVATDLAAFQKSR